MGNIIRSSAIVWMAIALWALPAFAVPIPWKNCGKPTDVVSVSSSNASVWPPQSGKPITFLFRATLKSDILAITGSLTVTYTSPSGESHQQVHTWDNAPVGQKTGPLNYTFTQVVDAPSGSIYTLHLSLQGQDGNEDICADVTVPIK
jgi:hypothetical protein